MGVRTPASLHLPKHVPAKNVPDFTFPNKDTPKTRSILDPNLWRETFWGVLHTPLHVYVKNPPGFIFPHPDAPKNAPDFTLPNKDTSKSCPILYPNLWRGTFRGVCNTPLHGYVQNLTGFISTHDMTRNLPDFRPKPSARIVLGRMLLRPTRVRAKPARFHTSAPGYVKNAPGFTFPNRDTPKTHPVLGANPCRRTFRAYAIRPYTGTCKI